MDFRPPRKDIGSPERPQRNSGHHGQRLQREWAAIWAKASETHAGRLAVQKPTKDGVYIQFRGAPGFDLKTLGLEDRKARIRLLSIYEDLTELPEHPKQDIATVFVPSGKEAVLRKKLEQYTQTGKKNEALVSTIESIEEALFGSFWRDDPALMPAEEPVWCEAWLRQDAESIDSAMSFRMIAHEVGIEVRPGKLQFPERLVVLCRANQDQLWEMTERFEYIAEFRRAKETASFFLEESNADQTAWAEELRRRISFDPLSPVAICILDTGVNRGHILLTPILAESDCHAVHPDWGTHDHDGHGTLMAGLASYGDLVEALATKASMHVSYCLESAKILPQDGENPQNLHGEVTQQGVSRAEITAPERRRVICLAISATDCRDFGRPSSWSAAVDASAAGADTEEMVRRLFVVAGGNLDDHEAWLNYPHSNYNEFIHDPAQAWNAVTVGAYTEKAVLTQQGLDGFRPIALPGQLSPYSATSLLEGPDRSQKDKWPSKPDIVMEGGNAALSPEGIAGELDDLLLLSTNWMPATRQFDWMNATSAATALASRLAAHIRVHYPEAWPETVRALMVHSARWPDALCRQVIGAEPVGGYSKTQIAKLLACCGYGVPNQERAIYTAQNAVTLVAQRELSPFKGETVRDIRLNTMHLHRVPWPAETLVNLGETPVTVRITLSYFIEPSPGERGWKDRYRYASHGFRFEMSKVNELEDDFRKRVNEMEPREEGETIDRDGASGRWIVGSKMRSCGSLHSDIWKDTAANIAAANLIAIYPVGGWWKERSWLRRWQRQARYSLVVSLETPNEEVDIYTEIATKIAITVGT